MKGKIILTTALSLLPILHNPKTEYKTIPENNNIAIIINDMQHEFLIKHDTTEINRELPNYMHVLEFAKNSLEKMQEITKKTIISSVNQLNKEYFSYKNK